MKFYQNYILYRDSTANEAQQKLIIQKEGREREQALRYQQQLTTIKARQQRNYYIAGIGVLLLSGSAADSILRAIRGQR